MRRALRAAAVPCAALLLGGCAFQVEAGGPGLSLGLHLALLGLLVLVLRDWLSLEPEWRVPAAVCLAAACAAGLSTGTMDPASIPAEWVTPLHEGTGQTSVAALYGGGAHAGGNLRAVLGWTLGDFPDLLRAVRLNLALGAANFFAFLLIAWRALGSPWAALGLAACFTFNRVWLHAALSEVPAQLMAVYLFSCAPAALVLESRAGATGRRLLAPLGLVAVSSILLAWTRSEMAIAGAAALACALARLAPLPAGVDPVTGRLSRVAGWKAGHKVLLGLLLLAPALLPSKPGAWTWVMDGLRPLNPSFLLLPVAALGFLPAGLVALSAAGCVRAFRRLSGSLGLPLSLLVLFRLYHSASDGRFCVAFRFLTHLSPMIFLLAALGWREISSFLSRRGAAPRTRAWALALLLVSFLLPPVRTLQFLYQGENLAGGILAPSGLCSGALQTEARYLLRLRERYPDRIFVAKNTASTASLGPWRGYQWTFFGKPMPQPRIVLKGIEDVYEAVSRQAWLPSAPLYYHGTDCGLLDAEGCREDIRGGRLVEERIFLNPGLCEPSQYGTRSPVARLAVYELDPARLSSVYAGPLPAPAPKTRTWLSSEGTISAWLAMERLGRLLPGAAARAFGGVSAGRWLEVARTARLAGLRDLSLRALARASLGPLTAEERVRTVGEYAALGEPGAAAKALRAWAGSPGASLPLEGLWSDLSREPWEQEEGRALLEAAVLTGPLTGTDAEAAGLARLYAVLGSQRRALELARGLMKKPSATRPPRVWQDLSFAAAKAGDRPLALRALTASGAAGESPLDRREKALQLQALGKLPAALAVLDSLVAAHPFHGGFRSDRGVLKALMGRRREALEDLCEALRLEPSYEDARMTLRSLWKDQPASNASGCPPSSGRPRRGSRR